MVGKSCVIDSDVAIDFLRRQGYAPILLSEWAAKGRIAASVLTHFEVFKGMRPDDAGHTGEFLSSLSSVDVTISIAQLAGTLCRSLLSKGISMGAADAIIAATALEMGVPLITNNVRHYSVPGLTVVHGRRGDSFRIGERRRRYSAK